eukprot:m.94636 g.94636  ORF g.94636 m.94636 type:complete len:437 (+) comp21871_c1_seq3:272-1582(+)
MSLNINRDVQDVFYRYKMPPIVAKVEGRGNGIKTVIPNMVEVAKALERPPSYPTKYFGYELGAQTQMEVKAERYIVNGAHSADDFQKLLDGFIKKFVLCPECNNPETELTVFPKNKRIEQKCKACGVVHIIKSTHKLTTFILNHPPNETGGNKGKKQGKGKKNRRGSPDSSNSVATTPTPRTNAEERADCTASVDTEVPGQDEEDGFDDWSEDTSAEAVRLRMQKQIQGNTNVLVQDQDAELDQGQRLDLFEAFVKKELKKDKFSPKAVLNEAVRLDVKDKSIMVLCSLLWTGSDIFTTIRQHTPLFVHLIGDSKKAQKYVLGGMEQLIERDRSLLSKVPRLLKQFYDDDIVDEKIILAWGEKVSKKYIDKKLSQEIHDKAAAFLKWLSEAEEEESSEEEEEEVELVFSSTPDKVEAPKDEPANNDDDDDFNIDDI